MRSIYRLLIVVLAFVCCLSIAGCTDYEYDYDKDAQITVQREMYYTSVITVNAKNIEGIRKSFYDKMSQVGGYVKSDNSNYSGEKITDVAIVFSVPTENFNQFVDYISDSAKVTDKTITAVDCTDQYFQIIAKKQALETKKAMLTETLNDAVSISDRVLIIDQITELDIELGIIDSELSNSQTATNHSTVIVYIYLPPTFFEIMMPYIILFIAPAIVLGIIFIPKIIRNRKNKKLATQIEK